MITNESISARYLRHKKDYSISSTTIMILEKSLVKRHDIKPILAMPFFVFFAVTILLTLTRDLCTTFLTIH